MAVCDRCGQFCRPLCYTVTTDRDRLKNILVGLEVENIDTLLSKDKELFLALGKEITKRTLAIIQERDILNSMVNPHRKFRLGQRVTKTKGSSWTGRVVGFYSTSLTPVGYAVESETETGSVQIYPESALGIKNESN